MPSIPQSLLWVSLVVLWLFVLVPMLISKRDAVRRTSDVALATRVLNSGAGARLLKRGGPAAGHRSDPLWRPEEELPVVGEYAEEDVDGEWHLDDAPRTGSVVMRVAAVDEAEPDYLDVDIVEEDSGALPAGRDAEADPALSVVRDHSSAVADNDLAEKTPLSAPEPAEARVGVVEPELDADVGESGTGHDGDGAEDAVDAGETDADEAEGGSGETEGDRYEYVEDTSGLEAEEDPPTTVTPGASRRLRYDSKTAAVSARKYAFRKRVLTVMALVLVVSAVTAFTVVPTTWWVCGSAAGATMLYLAYLRRQTRIEEQLRRRRMQRAARSRLGVENALDRELDVVPSRLRRPGAVVLEIDDEDPIFEHLEYASFARDYDLPRAAGQ